VLVNTLWQFADGCYTVIMYCSVIALLTAVLPSQILKMMFLNLNRFGITITLCVPFAKFYYNILSRCGDAEVIDLYRCGSLSSWISCVHAGTIYDKYLAVFVTLHNLVGMDCCILIKCMLWYSTRLDWERLFIPILVVFVDTRPNSKRTVPILYKTSVQKNHSKHYTN